MAWKEPYTLKDDSKRYRVVWRERSGRKRSKTFLRSKDADVFALETERREQLGTLFDEPPITLGEFLPDWKARYRTLVRSSTFDRRMDIMKYLEPYKGRLMEEIAAREIEDDVTRLAHNHPRTARLVLETFKLILRNAQARGQRVDSGIFLLKNPKYERREPRFLTLEEVDALGEASREPRLIRFAALTGLRQGEIFALQDADLNTRDGTVTVRRTLYEGHLVLTKTKASKRTIKLAGVAVQLLREQLLARPQGTKFVFPAPKGGPWSANNFDNRVFVPAREKSGLGDVRFHDLRHTYASLMIRAGTHPKVLQGLMGHSSMYITMDTYGHLYEGAADPAVDAFEALLRRELPHQCPMDETLVGAGPVRLGGFEPPTNGLEVRRSVH